MAKAMDDPQLSDEDLRRRTETLIRAAEAVSVQLQQQTARLAVAIDMLDRDIIAPLRKGLQD